MDRPIPEKLRELGERVSFTYTLYRDCQLPAFRTVPATIVGRSFQRPYKYDIMTSDGTIRHSVLDTELGAALPEQKLNRNKLLKFSGGLP